MAEAFLQIIAGPREGLNVPLFEDRPLVVGRKNGDLILNDPLVSSRHCRLVPKEGQYWLQDLGSTNGTLVNGKLAKEIRLEPGAEIAIGATRMVLYVGEDTGAATQNAEQDVVDSQLHIAWLLDEELVESKEHTEVTRSVADIIGQDLRLPPNVRADIEVVSGADAGKTFRCSRGNVAIGRKFGEVPLSDAEVSKRHAVLEVFGREMVFLRDLGSTNGTYHNGRRITVAKVSHGDTIGIGKTVLRLQISV